MYLEPVDTVEVDLGAVECVAHGGAQVRHDIGIAGVAVEFLAQAEADGVVSPALDPPDRADPGCSRRKSSLTRTTPEPPSVIWLQS